MNRNSVYKILKYILAGLISAGVELAVFSLSKEFMGLYFASVFSFFCGLISSYCLNKFIVFKKSGLSGPEIARFATLGIINSQISSFMTVWFSSWMAEDLAKLLSMAFIAAWSFTIMNFAIFRNKQQESN